MKKQSQSAKRQVGRKPMCYKGIRRYTAIWRAKKQSQSKPILEQMAPGRAVAGESAKMARKLTSANSLTAAGEKVNFFCQSDLGPLW
ncbi:MAG: hypothetical protein ACYSWQ_06770 [Planctomycetota bacterium]